MEGLNAKTKVALLSVTSNITLIILKVVAGILSGSVSIISEAIHSGMDLIAAIIAFISVKLSSKPADKDHPYGHGKYENVSGVIEGILIFIAAFLIIKEAVEKIAHPTEIKETTVAIIVMGISALVNTVVSRKLYKVAKREDSIALEADALHLKTDVYTSLGVALGLLLIAVTKIAILDPIVAILVAILIIKESWVLCKSAFTPLIDAKLPDDEEDIIVAILDKYNEHIVDYHALRTRKSGHIRYIDFHVTLEDGVTLKEARGIIKDIEADIEGALNNIEVNIYIEPRNN